MDSKPFGNGSILEIFQENIKNWVWDFISQTLWNGNPPLSHYVLSILDFFSLEWRFHLKLEFNEDFYPIMVDIQIPDPNLFYFPGVFPEYCKCQKVLSPNHHHRCYSSSAAFFFLLLLFCTDSFYVLLVGHINLLNCSAISCHDFDRFNRS